mmetsp:Transcript_6934/g.19576  ORF Transcript_6934/g.19576 Transcript_6934/m.19576 type:complete len:531 (+) Transcript_6934:201-1793(+)|eukprot:CAMPEP_0117654886 /NCGR_PEP_ID=MMETSP0804-20121206/3986_1 /TAXON_ID=1074897 /ORGANISM="Tetraselmis astigmatica, Strain CCMP880" /LENGTH=530 /DNA_ID=CAMNT_0005461203 /DNA_START=203 /DNA_END=1795 /DNA_ORIENTATION=+
MEHIRNARQQVENQIKHLTNGQYSTNLLGESLEDLAKKCTAKTLPAPDPQANEAFLEAVRSSSAEEDSNASRELVSVLRRRLAMENSHKQWLAIHLVSDLMRESPQSLTSSGREEVLACVADLTRHPSTKTNNPNGEAASESMRKTKLAALDLLRTTGGMGQQALRHAAGIGGAADMQRALQHAQHQHQGGGGNASSWQVLASDTDSCISTVQGHVELLQELLLGDGTGDFEQDLINDLMSEMVTYAQTFEPLLGQLAAIEMPEAEALLAKALEAFDMIGQCQQLQSDVVEARLTGQAPPGASASAPAPATAAAAPALNNQNSFDALGLGELQSALEATQTPPAAPFAQMSGDPFAAPPAAMAAVADPFAASTSPPPAGAANPFGQSEPLMAASPQGAAVDPFAALATGADPFLQTSAETQQSPPPAPQPSAVAAVDPFAALTATGPVPTASTQSPNSHLSPEALLQDLTKAPKAGGTPEKGVPMKAAGASQFSANNPFAAVAPAAPAMPAPETAAAIDDEWDKFFAERA